MSVVDFINSYVGDIVPLNVVVLDKALNHVVTYVSGFSNRDALIGILKADLVVKDVYAEDDRLVITSVMGG